MWQQQRNLDINSHTHTALHLCAGCHVRCTNVNQNQEWLSYFFCSDAGQQQSIAITSLQKKHPKQKKHYLRSCTHARTAVDMQHDKLARSEASGRGRQTGEQHRRMRDVKRAALAIVLAQKGECGAELDCSCRVHLHHPHRRTEAQRVE
jgi:hypothetical protein